jgi:hypothetical protein
LHAKTKTVDIHGPFLSSGILATNGLPGASLKTAQKAAKTRQQIAIPSSVAVFSPELRRI